MDVNLKGTIVTNDDADVLRFWGWLDLTCPMDIHRRLAEADGQDVTLLVNSAGGDLLAGSEIGGALRRYPGKTTSVIQSHSASAATVAMMGCDEIIAEPCALICVHNPSATVEGDSREHQKTAEELETIKQAVINAYMGRAKVSRKELAALMDRDRWMTPQEALHYGLIDAIRDGDKLDSGVGGRYVNAAYAYPIITTQMREAYAQSVAPTQYGRELARLALLKRK